MEKAFWQLIKARDLEPPEGHTTVDLVPELMAGLGSLDPELRDNLCYEILGGWVEQGRFSADQLRGLAAHLMANLKSGLGEAEQDGVFLRSFSVLILVEIVHYDGKHRLFRTEEVLRILDEAITYLASERDLRGFVPDKGWAHSVAHTANLMTALAAHPALGEAGLVRLLDAIRARVQAQTAYPFVDREPFRLARAVIAAARRPELPVHRMRAWFMGFVGAEHLLDSFVPGRDSVCYHNTESFLAAVHWMLTFKELPEESRAELLEAAHAALAWHFPWDA
ncbi:MAG: DUF2785 domain-containing protein [Mycobacterium leprae]